MKDDEKRRMKTAVAICTNWLASKGLEQEADERLRPLRLSAYQRTHAMLRAMVNLMEKGYVIRATADGRIQAVTLDDMPPGHREEINRRRSNATSSGISYHLPEDSNG